jgi:hypothetical protein
MVRDNNQVNKTLLIGIVIFLLLSATDFAFTWKLVAAANSDVDEVNPLASWILEQFGWGGLAAYKLTLVSFIAAVVAVIAHRRRHVGEAVMMFGCGAQASVVITSILLLQSSNPMEMNASNMEITADPQRVESGGFLPLGGYVMLTKVHVQKELGLSTDAIKQINDIERTRSEIRRRLRTENVVELYDVFLDQYEKERLLGVALSDKQMKRLQEICWQARGPLAFFDRDVVCLLELSETQINDLHQIRLEKLENMSFVTENMSFVTDWRAAILEPEITGKLLAVLDANQQQKWQSMQGERFQLELQSANLNGVPTSAVAE